MTKDEYIEEIKEIKDMFGSMADKLKSVIVQPDLSLEYRWSIFLEGAFLLDNYYYTPASMDILSDTMYDDFNMERRETRSFSDIDDQIMENYDLDDETGYAAKYNRMYAKRDEWREAVLQAGYKGFTYDW